MKKNYNKKVILAVLLVALLIAVVGGVTYAFFNYTRTGVANTLQVGRIAFNSTQNNTIRLENVFPTSSTNLNSSNSDTVTITITGDTTYSEGIEYKVTLEGVNNTINGKEVPISFNVTASNLGNKDTSYYTNRGGENPIYNLTETGQVEDGKYILVGYIPNGATGVNGSIDITAFVDASNIAISDTVSRIDNGNLIYGETTGEWIAGREVFTTTEWNSFNSGNPLSFKVRVEANEGIWIEEEQYYVLAHISSNSNWTGIGANITSIEFHKDGVAPTNPLSSFDATDVTSKGTVTVYTVDDGLGHNTRKAIIVADDEIYAPENSRALFSSMPKLTTINLDNFRMDNVTTMKYMFTSDTNLTDINISDRWNTSNVIDMNGMFAQCIHLSDVSGLEKLDTSNVTDMEMMFAGCTSLSNVDGLINWNTSNVQSMNNMFRQCTSLSNVDGLINWNTSNVQSMNNMFRQCTMSNVNGLTNWNTSSVQNMNSMFYQCTNLSNVDGLRNWNTSNVTNMLQMFYQCTNLSNVDGLRNWNTSNVEYMHGMFTECTNLTDFSPLANWNTSNVTSMARLFAISDSQYSYVIDANIFTNWNVSNVTDMSNMFMNRSLNSYYPLRNWNVSNVQNFTGVFNATSSSPITTLTGLENWDVSSATNMSGMFWDNFSLKDASAINNWNINASIDFTQMFYHDIVHPEFTKVAGTWDSEGTFTPNA